MPSSVISRSMASRVPAGWSQSDAEYAISLLAAVIAISMSGAPYSSNRCVASARAGASSSPSGTTVTCTNVESPKLPSPSQLDLNASWDLLSISPGTQSTKAKVPVTAHSPGSAAR